MAMINGSEWFAVHSKTLYQQHKKNIIRLRRKQSRTGEHKVEQAKTESEVDRHSSKMQFWVASLRGTKLEVVGISLIDS